MSETDATVVGTRRPQQPVQGTCSFARRRQDGKMAVNTTAKQEGIKNGKASASPVKRK